MSPNLPWDSNYSRRLLDFLRDLNNKENEGQPQDTRILLFSSKNLFLHLDFPESNNIPNIFNEEEKLLVTIHATKTENRQKDGIQKLSADLQRKQSSPISFLSEVLLKESAALGSFRRNFAQEQEQARQRQARLKEDLRILAKEKRDMKNVLLQKALLLINEKKEKVNELCAKVEEMEQENQQLKTELAQAQEALKAKRARKRVKHY